MERGGLVAQVEAELERMLYQNALPANWRLAPEQKLARRYGVCRGTVREALKRLATKGLVVKRPGRQTRVVAFQDAVTLETLSLTLGGRKPVDDPEQWRPLEDYFALKRELTVEVLALCCEEASAAELDRVASECYAMMDEARWNEDGAGWARREFAMLRVAARVVNRPGHLLLLNSLERSFWEMARWVLPRLNARAVQAWAMRAFHTLFEKNARAVRQELPMLLQAVEAPLWKSLQPNHPEVERSEARPRPPDEPHDSGQLPPGGTEQRTPERIEQLPPELDEQLPSENSDQLMLEGAEQSSPKRVKQLPAESAEQLIREGVEQLPRVGTGQLGPKVDPQVLLRDVGHRLPQGVEQLPPEFAEQRRRTGAEQVSPEGAAQLPPESVEQLSLAGAEQVSPGNIGYQLSEGVEQLSPESVEQLPPWPVSGGNLSYSRTSSPRSPPTEPSS